MTLDPETDAHEPHHSTSSTAHVLTELQLYGWHPYEDEPDPRPLPEGSQIAGAVAGGGARAVLLASRSGRAARDGQGLQAQLESIQQSILEAFQMIVLI